MTEDGLPDYMINTSPELQETIYRIVSNAGEIVDDWWIPYHEVTTEEEITKEFLDRYVTVRDNGYYIGEFTDRAATLGYCLSMYEAYSIESDAEFATPEMLRSKYLNGKILTDFQQKQFEVIYNKGYMLGQTNVAQQLYNLAQMGEFKAIDKFLEVRGAFNGSQKESGPSIQITVVEDTDVIDSVASDTNVVAFPNRI